MQVFAGHNASVQGGDFTPDGKRIATGDGNGSLILWDPRSPAPLWKLTGADGRFSLKGGITALAINPSSSLVVVGGSAGGIRVVNLAKGTVVGALEGHDPGESIEAIEFLEFGAGASIGQGSGIMATGGTDGKICIWDLAVMKLRSTLQHDVRNIGFILFCASFVTYRMPVYRTQLLLLFHTLSPMGISLHRALSIKP
jgi:ribosome assembly protein SQT1